MTSQAIPDVRKSVVVPVPPADAFRAFTERLADWWPPSHVLLTTPRTGLAMEPRAGGRYYEWDAEGQEVDWGRVLTWEPPHRLLLTWRVDGSFRPLPDDEGASEIEVLFTPEPGGGTRVELAHIRLDRLGADAERIVKALDGPSPGETLARFAEVAR
ncbi:SRPBCC family protein [Streptomyces sp. NPDC093252]|uniref:SRPBCC family protein n=1 Tax=Streptomyces sp. NPDC093252 TaxID=3154980 RepID=UPI00341D7D7C